MASFKVTPWEVTGAVDYDKLVKDFGTSLISPELLSRIKKHTKDIHFMLRRKIFYSHRDMNWVLDEYDKSNKFFLYTGRGPSGTTHIGHLSPYVFTKWLQDKFKVDVYYQLTDDEKFLFSGTGSRKELTLEETNKLAHDNLLDFIAVGFDAKRTHVIIDTEHIKQQYNIALKVAKKITFSTAKAVFGFTNESNIGQIFFTAVQAAPCFLPSVIAGKNIPCLVPMGIDQDPHFRVARDVAEKLGWHKPAAIHKKMFPGLLEGGKMSASDPNSSIYVTDTEAVVDKKIRAAFSGGQGTVEEHRKLGGNPDVDAAYQMLYNMFEPDDKKLKKLHDDYVSGKLLTSELKAYTSEKINKFLKEHRRKRELARKLVGRFMLIE